MVGRVGDRSDGRKKSSSSRGWDETVKAICGRQWKISKPFFICLHYRRKREKERGRGGGRERNSEANSDRSRGLAECHPHQIIFKLMINIYKSVLLYRKHIWIIVRRIGMGIMNSRGPAPKPIVRRALSHLHNGSYLRPRSFSLFLDKHHAYHHSSPLFSPFPLSLSLPLCSLSPSQQSSLSPPPRSSCEAISLEPRFERTTIPPSLARRWPLHRSTSLATASLCEPKLDSIPNPDCFLLCPPKLSKWMQPAVPPALRTAPPSLLPFRNARYVKRSRH